MSRFVLSQASGSDDDTTASEYELLAPVHEVIKASGFRFSAKKALLTYAQCQEDPLDILDKLDARYKIKRAVGAIELHADGQPHIHLAIEYEKKLNTTNSRAWDYAYDESCEIHHPNVGKARVWKACINYCRGKEKTMVQLVQYRCSFEEALDQADVDSVGQKKPDLFSAVVGKSRAEWIQYCFEQNAGQFCELVWKWYNRSPDVHTISEVDPPGQKDPNFDARFEYMLLPLLDDKPLIICGPSGSGKTTWAVKRMVERYGTILMVNNIDQIKMLNLNVHKAILFDEIRFTGHPDTGKGQWPLESQIAVVDTERGRSIHCRYTDGALPKGFPRVFTATTHLPFSRDYQIERRVNILNMYPGLDKEDLWLSFK